MLKEVLILENSTTPLGVNENVSAKSEKIILEGEFTRFRERNRNDRIYTAENFLPQVDELLERKRTLGVVFGEYDHPTVFDTALARTSHTIENLYYNKEKNAVNGEIRLLSNHWGKEARSLVLVDKINLFCSSRCAGVTNDQGIVEVKKLFTYDIVGDPGFATTRMSLKCLNESLNYSKSVPFRIYDLTEDTNMQTLMEDNKNNENDTRNQIKEYSLYLASELNSLKKSIQENKKVGIRDERVDALLEQFENNNKLISKISQYLEYLSAEVKSTVVKTAQFESKLEKTVEHIDYIGETLENSIGYTESVAKTTKDVARFTEYAVSKISEVADFAENIAVHTKNAIEFTEHLAEHVSNGHKFTEYVASNANKIIRYNTYLKEHIESSIEKTNMVAEKLDNTVEFVEHIAEGANNVIGYSKYLSEHVENNIHFSEQNAKYINASIGFTEKIVEALNSNKIISESKDQTKLPLFENFMQDNDIEDLEEMEEERRMSLGEMTGMGSSEESHEEEEEESEEKAHEETAHDTLEDEELIDSTKEDEEMVMSNESKYAVGSFVRVNSMKKIGRVKEVINEQVFVEVDGRVLGFGDHELTLKENKSTNITESISSFISEIKKREAVKNQEPHFLTFLSPKQKAEYRALSTEQKDKVAIAFSEKRAYASQAEVLQIIEESLNGSSKPSFRDVLVANIPMDLQSDWEELTTNEQAKFLAESEHYDLSSQGLMESFWRTRHIKKAEPLELLTNYTPKFEHGIDNNTMQRMLEKFNSIKS